MAKTIKQSETIVIKRSQINFAPYNPRKESKHVVDALKRNFKNVGYLGGIVWNETTGNLVGGHKRVQAMDVHFGYDSTDKTDYDVKVEKVVFDLKTEKEQNIFLNNPRVQGETDHKKISEFINEIDIVNTGLNEYDLNIIQALNPNFNFGATNGIENDFIDNSDKSIKREKDNSINPADNRTDDEKRESIKQLKNDIKNNIREENRPSYFTVTFENYEAKAEFLESLEINGNDVFINGNTFKSKIFED